MLPVLPAHRSPTPPGEVLREEFLKPMGLGLEDAAKALGVTPQQLAGVIEGSLPVTPDLADRLAGHFGTTPAFWLNLQKQVDSLSNQP